MTRSFTIRETTVADETDAYVIAEIGHNHGGSVELCREMVTMAKLCGVNAVKLQKRHNKNLYTDAFYQKPYENKNSYGRTYGEHREALEFGEEQYREIQSHAAGLGLHLFATPFDPWSADFLADLDVPAYKIPSGLIGDIGLIRHVANFGRPVIISTGGATWEDIDRATACVPPENLCIMQCTAAYPARPSDVHLEIIEQLRKRYRVIIGYSGHDNGILIPSLAYLMGARVIEKHFTLDRAMKGTDHAFSLEPEGLRKMVRDLKRTREAYQQGWEKQPLDIELEPIRKMSKSWYAAHDLEPGTVLAETDVTLRSPGGFLPPFISPLGMRLEKGLKRHDPIPST